MIKILKLQTEGRLQSGDTIYEKRLGNCTVVTISDNATLIVRDALGKYFSLSGLSLPGEFLKRPQEDV